MKFVCDRDMLLSALGFVTKYVSRTGFNETTKSVYLLLEGDQLYLRSCNGALFTNLSIPVIDVDGEGAILVNPDLFTTIIETMGKGDIRFSSKKRLSIRQDKRQRYIAVSDADDFPLIPRIEDTTPIELSTQTILDAMDQVGFARSQTVVLPTLKGFYLELSKTLSLICCDTERMAFCTLDADEVGGAYVIPAEGMFAVKSAVGLEQGCETIIIRATEFNWTKITVGDIDIYAATLAGEYPTQVTVMLETLLNKEKATEVIVDVETIDPIVRLAGKLASWAETTGASVALEVTVLDGALCFDMDTPSGAMDDTIDATVSGPDVTFKILPKHFLDLVQAAPSSQISISIWNSTDPLLIQDMDQTWYVVQALMGGPAEAAQYRQEEEEGDF